jgi:hypothetical protein
MWLALPLPLPHGHGIRLLCFSQWSQSDRERERKEGRGGEHGDGEESRGSSASGGCRRGERAIAAGFCFLPSYVVSKEIRGRGRGKEGERREGSSRARRMAAEGEHGRLRWPRLQKAEASATALRWCLTLGERMVTARLQAPATTTASAAEGVVWWLPRRGRTCVYRLEQCISSSRSLRPSGARSFALELDVSSTAAPMAGFYSHGRSVPHQNIFGDCCSCSSARRQGDNEQRWFVGHVHVLARDAVVSCQRRRRKG